jgi:hypothetical protein
MNEQHNEFDVFGEPSMTAVAEPSAEPVAAFVGPDPRERRAAKQKSSTPGGKGTLLSYGLIGTVVIAGLAWVFWPMQPARALRPARMPSTALAPADTPLAAEAVIAPHMPPSGDQTVSNPPSAPPVPPAMASSEGVPAALRAEPAAGSATARAEPARPANPSAAAEANAASAVIAAQVSDIQARLASTDAALLTIGAKIDALAVKKKRAPAAKPDRPVKAAVAGVAKATAVKTPATVRALSGQVYTITSINRGVAWIQAGDHVEVVQPGDRIGTTRVLSIDPLARKIETSDGVIQ